jgi:hypothetical protein
MEVARGGGMADGSKEPVVFISYSHLDEPDLLLHPGEDQWLSFVTSHLKPYAAHYKLELWDDRRIDGGANWRAEIDGALDRCAVCVFLVSRHSLSSRFILDVEMKRILERHQDEGAYLYPIVITPVDLRAAPWLHKLNLRPTNGVALELYDRGGRRNKVMSDLAAEIHGIIERTAAGAAKDNVSLVLRKTRRQFLAASTIIDLQKALYAIEAFERVHGKSVESQLLHDQILKALRFEERETEASGAVAASTDKARIEAFLRDWPKGQHAAAAKARIAKLRRDVGGLRVLLGAGAAATAPDRASACLATSRPNTSCGPGVIPSSCGSGFVTRWRAFAM